MSKLICDLDPAMQLKARNAFELMNDDKELKEMGVDSVVISETKRELCKQMAYFSRGRMEPKYVKMMYIAAGLYEPSETECRTINTQTLSSHHIVGKAIDLVPEKDGKLWWTAPQKVWDRMGVIGERCGLKWGGRWKDFSDCPHFEI